MLYKREIDFAVQWFHQNVGKTFAVFTSSALKMLQLLKALVGKLSQLIKNLQNFSHS